jgi:hypothetical protein
MYCVEEKKHVITGVGADVGGPSDKPMDLKNNWNCLGSSLEN